MWFPWKSTTCSVASADRAAHLAARPGLRAAARSPRCSDPLGSLTYHRAGWGDLSPHCSLLPPRLRVQGVEGDQATAPDAPSTARQAPGARTPPEGRRPPALGHAGLERAPWSPPVAGSGCCGRSSVRTQAVNYWHVWGGAQIDHCRDAPQSEMTKAPWGLLAQCQAESGIGAGTALRNAG